MADWEKILSMGNKEYIGGNTDEARGQFWQNYPRMAEVTDSVAGAYGIDPKTLRRALDREGFTDARIREHNEFKRRGEKVPDDQADRWLSSETKPNTGYAEYGLDYVGNLIDEGKVKPKGAKFEYDEVVNEKSGKPSFAANGYTHLDNISLTAAMLKYVADTVKRDHPDLSDEEARRYVRAYYNRGVAGGRRWARNGAKGYND